jgi:DNA polymerase III delta subunit
MLIWQLHILAIVKLAGQKSPDVVAKETKISPFTVRKTQGLARRITLSQLKDLVRSLREFDVRLKSESLDADEVVQYYLMNLAS